MPIITGYYFRYRPPLSPLMPTLKTRVTILPKIFSGLRRKSVSIFFLFDIIKHNFGRNLNYFGPYRPICRNL